MPKVSIIMNCLNGEAFVREAIESIYQQTEQDWEIIFFDNCSTDMSAQIAQSYDHRLRYFKTEKTIPLGAARNKAIEQATGTYISFLDCDDTWVSEKLEQQVTLLDAHAHIGFVYANFFVFDSIKNKKKLALTTPQPDGAIFNHMLATYGIGLLSVMIRRSLFSVVDSQFDEHLNFASDYDLFLRILHETEAKYIHEPLGTYRIHSNMFSFKSFKRNLGEIEYTLNKLRKLYVDFDVTYADSLCQLQKQQDYAQVWFDMVSGNLNAVRAKPYLLRSGKVKLIILFILSFLPVRVWQVLQSIWVYVRGNKEVNKMIVNGS